MVATGTDLERAEPPHQDWMLSERCPALPPDMVTKRETHQEFTKTSHPAAPAELS